MTKLRSKILFGLIFLLLVIFILSITGIISIYYLSEDSKAIIKDNYASIEFSTNMLNSLENVFLNQLSFIQIENRSAQQIAEHKDILQNQKAIFNKNLERQKLNITEVGEDKIVNNLIRSYEGFISYVDSLEKINQFSSSSINKLKTKYLTAAATIRQIYSINMKVIYKKSNIAAQTAARVSIYMTIAASASILITLIFIFYFPSYITSPINELTKKIEDISERKYNQRIDVQTTDELNTLAAAFNKMAIKLTEYEEKHIDELLLEKRKMETLVVNLQDGILLLDNNFRILHVNPKFCEITGFNLTGLLGKQLSELKGDNEVLSQINLINAGKVKTHLSEKIKPIKILINNQPEYYQILLLDIRKESRTEIKSEPFGYILLIKNITKYEERNLAKSNLIATISHELKTPLSSINLSIKLLEDERIGSLNKEQKEFIESIKLHSKRILNLVNEVLDFTQAETGHIKLNISPYEVREIIELGTFAILLMLNEKGIDLELSIPNNLPKVKCDLEKTVWIVVNILNNAIRYSSRNGKIKITAQAENNFVVISIIDDGPGITEEEQKKIFDKYVKSKSDHTKGTGLGLAIAKEFVEVQGGTINVESTFGSGSKFSFSLPVA